MTDEKSYRVTITCDPVPAEPLFGALRDEPAVRIAGDTTLTWTNGEALIKLVTAAPAELLELVARVAPGAVVHVETGQPW